MPDTIGNTTVPEIAISGTFPITPEYPYGRASHPDVAIHQFGSGNLKLEQRFLLGTGIKRFTVRRSWLRDAERIALRDFWESKYGPYGAFTYNAPNDDGVGTTAYTCRFADEPLSWEMVADWACSVGITLVEIPAITPDYTLNSTLSRFPSQALSDALLSQVQQVIPLLKIQPLEAGYPAIYLSDRRCNVGGQLYQARLLSFDGISQGMGGESDDASFTFGNADRVMRDLANDVDLYRATIAFSLFHVGTGVKLDLWKGAIINWSLDDGPEFKVSAADGLYELNLPYPPRKISRACWKPFDSQACPYAQQGALDLVHFPSADATKCDKAYDTPNGCLAHGMKRYYGAILAEPQGVRIKDNSTGTWGFGRSPLTSVSQVADSIYDQVLPQIYTDSDMPVNCKIAAGRDESDFYEAMGIVGEGPLTFTTPRMVDKDGDGKAETFVGHTLDGQLHHGFPNNSLGLRTIPGNDPAGAGEFFSLDQSGNQTGSDSRKVYYGNSTYKDNFAAGTAAVVIRRTDPKGLQLSKPAEHQMVAVVAQGLHGWIWTDSGDHQTFVRTSALLTNPLWIAVNMLLRARGVWLSDAATQEQFFDVQALADATLVNGQPKGAALVCDLMVDAMVGAGQERQFTFRGVMQEEKPLRDWLQEVLMNCLGYFTFTFGKLTLGLRQDSSAVDAFTEGNILFRSLQLAPLKPTFNHLTANFADVEYDFVTNSVTVYDIDHAALVAGGAGPLFLKSNVNLAGTSSKSQASRIISVRLREELGGITPTEWKKARQVAFRTTVLALNTEPGMVCSMTHPSMPDGSGEFRVTAWRLNPDFSIDIQGRTTTDSMYDLLTGPKPADVAAAPVPIEITDPMPGDVLPIGGEPFLVTQTPLPSGDVAFDFEYDPPDPISSFSGVYGVFEIPEGSGKLSYSTDQPYPISEANRHGTCRIVMPSPGAQEQWRVALCSCAPTFRKAYVAHDDASSTPTPNKLVTVDPAPGQEPEPMPLAAKPTGATATLQYAVFTAKDGTKSLRFRWFGSITPPVDDNYLECRIVAVEQSSGATLEVGRGADGYIGQWLDIAPGTYTLRFYSVNKENAENPDYFSLADKAVSTMPAAPAITNIRPFDGCASLVEFADFDTDAGLVRKYRYKALWDEGSGGDWAYYDYTLVEAVPSVGAAIALARERGGRLLTDWFDIGAAETFHLRFTPYNRLGVASAAQNPPGNPAYSITGIGAAGNVRNYSCTINTQAVDTPTGRKKQWNAKLHWDLPADTTNFGWCVPTVVYTVPGAYETALTTQETEAWDDNHLPTSWFDVANDCTFSIQMRTYNKAGELVANPTVLGPYTLTKDPSDIPVSVPAAPPDPSVVSCAGRLTEADAQNNRWIELTIQYDPPASTATAPFTGVMVYVDHPDSGGGNAVLGSTTLGGTTTLNQAFAPQAFGPFAPVGTGRQTLQVKCPMPQQDEQWAVYLVPNGKQVVRRDESNHSAYVTLAIDMTMAGGNPQPGTGVSGQEWAPVIDKTTISGGGAAGAFIEYRNEQGIPQYRWNVRFTPPVDARYGGCVVQETGFGAIAHPMTTLTRNATTFVSAWWTAPTVPTDLTLHFLSVDPQGRQNTEVAGVTPNVTASRVCRPSAAQGQEYASGVLMPSVDAHYAYNAHGRYVLQVDIAWIDPYLSQDTAYTGCVIYIQAQGEAAGGHAATGIIPRGTQTQRLEISDFPTSAQIWKVNIRSCAGLNQNTYKAATTPEVSFPVGPPPQGTAGREFCDLVTNQSATPQIMSANADGTTQTVIRIWFDKPADPRWEGCDIRVQKVPGGTWEMAIPNVSILPSNGLGYVVTTPNAAATWTFAFISHDQAGQNNSYQAGITPTASVAVGTTKKSLDVRYAAPEAYDGTVEVTGTSTITVNITASTKTITWVSGPLFSTAWPAGMAVTINGGGYTIASVTNSFTLTVNEAPPGNATGVQFVAQGLFRARSITLDYNGQVTTLANESATITTPDGQATVGTAINSRAGNYAVVQAPGSASWTYSVPGSTRQGGVCLSGNVDGVSGMAYGKLRVYANNPDPGYTDQEQYTEMRVGLIQLSSKYRGGQDWLELRPCRLDTAAIGTYRGKMIVYVANANGVGYSGFFIPLYQ